MQEPSLELNKKRYMTQQQRWF